MELRRYFSLVLRWLWLIALCILLGAGLGFLVSINTTRVYEASTTLLINQAPSTTGPNYDSLLTSESLARTYAEVLRSRPVLQNVLSTLKLDTTADNLAKSISVDVIQNTQLLVVTVQDTDDVRAANVANATVSEFSKQNQARQAQRYASSEQTLQDQLNSLQADITRTQSSIDALGSSTSSADATQRNNLGTSLTQYRTSYATLLGNLEDVRRAEAESTNNVDVVEQAQPEAFVIRPKTLNNVLLGAMMGLLLAIGIIFLRDYLDDTVKSAEEVERLTESIAMGTIATIEGVNEAERVVTSTNNRSPVAEAYRVLRANIEFSEVDSPFRTILVTSSSPGEGKSTTLANLAAAIAVTGKRVIAVDTDLRKPTLHKYFGLSNSRGVTTALLGHGGKLSEHLVPTTASRNLMIMPSGPLPPNPAELIGSQRMSELIQELASHADVVLFDSPPMLAVVDGALLARQCDATLLVVLARSTRKDSLRKSKDQLVQSGTRLLGFVLNRVSPKGGGYYYYSYGVYGVEAQRKRPWQRGANSTQRDTTGPASPPAPTAPGPNAPRKELPEPVGAGSLDS